MSHLFSTGLRHTSDVMIRIPGQLSGRRYYSSMRNYQTNRALIWSCIGGSVGIFAAWGYSMGSWGVGNAGRGNVISSWNTRRVRKFLDDNFTLKLSDVNNGKYWTLITSAFSHISFYHLLGNMFSLHAFSSYASLALPPSQMASLLAGSALFGSIGWLYHEKSQGRAEYTQARALGASGMVMGVGSAAACLMPNARVLLMAVVPVPLWVLVPAYFLYDAYYLNATDSRVAHAGHIGGSVFGVVYYALVLRRFGGILGPRYTRF